MASNLILGAWSGRQIGVPSVFVNSVRAAVPNATIVVFCHDISTDAERFFKDHGVQVISFRHWSWWDGPVHTYRFLLFARYAAIHAREYDHIITTDIRDVVIQSNPFARLESRRVHFFREHGGETLVSNGHYAKWMQRFVSAQDRAICANEVPVCCGVILGGAAEMTDYLRKLTRYITGMNFLRRRKFGADSAFHNLMCYVTHEVPSVVVTDGELVATMGDTGDDRYFVDGGGVVRRSDGHAPPICHQYDRYPEIERAIYLRYV